MGPGLRFRDFSSRSSFLGFLSPCRGRFLVTPGKTSHSRKVNHIKSSIDLHLFTVPSAHSRPSVLFSGSEESPQGRFMGCYIAKEFPITNSRLELYDPQNLHCFPRKTPMTSLNIQKSQVAIISIPGIFHPTQLQVI